MASMSAQPSPRTTSPDNQRQANVEASQPDEPTAPSMISEDSQTVLLDNSSSSAANQEQSTHFSRPRPAAPSRSSTLGIKKCWICICDSTEDDPVHPPRWRSPCKCNLTAHEACLLDWVADLENPRGRRGGPPKQIQCPQCKSEIKIARPRSFFLAGVRACERVIGTATLPGMAAILGGTLWAGCYFHGLHSVRIVFGETHAIGIYTRAQKHWGWLSAYALIPLSLISARTNYADFVLPGSAIFLFATQLTEKFAIDWTIWPPRPSTVFGCLPVVRNCYNYLYEKAFGNLNRKWLQEIQPRQAQEGNDDNRNEADRANDAAAVANEMGEGDVLLELNLEFGLEEQDDEDQPEDRPEDQAAAGDRRPEGQQAQAQLAQPQPALDNPDPPPPHVIADDGVAHEDARQANPPPANPIANNPEGNNADPNAAPAGALMNRRPNEIISDTSSVLVNTLGALLFPSIAAGMGELLKLTLPLSWIQPHPQPPIPTSLGSTNILSRLFSPLFPSISSSASSSSSSPSLQTTGGGGTGRESLLRTKWGRSVVGGCLFVVLKDMLVLYVRWRMARNHRGRKVMDFDKTRKEFVLVD